MVGALRLPLGGLNAKSQRARQARAQEEQVPGLHAEQDPAHLTLYNTPREAAVALAMLKQRHEEQADPIRHIDFASPAPPACLAALRPDGWLPGGRLPLRPELEPCVSELPCVRVGTPMTVQQLSLARMWGMPCVHAMPCTANMTGSMLAAMCGA